jgi:hypothetical protein
LRLLVEIGGHGAFVAAFRNRAEIVLAHIELPISEVRRWRSRIARIRSGARPAHDALGRLLPAAEAAGIPDGTAPAAAVDSLCWGRVPPFRRMDAPVKAIAHRPGTQQTQPVHHRAASRPLLHCPRARSQAAPRSHRRPAPCWHRLTRLARGTEHLRSFESTKKKNKGQCRRRGAEGNGHPAPTPDMGCPIIPGCWRSASSIDLLRLEIECQLLPQSARFWRAKSLNAHCFARLFWEPSKLMTRVRFPSPAPTFARSALRSASRACAGSNRGGLAARVSDGRRGLALASTKGHEKFSRGAAAAPRSVAQWLEHRSPKPGVGGSSPSTPASKIKDLCR